MIRNENRFVMGQVKDNNTISEILKLDEAKDMVRLTVFHGTKI